MTFEEIRKRVLRKLDTSPEITGELADDVNESIRDIYDEIVTEVRPDELLTSATYTIPQSTSTISITSSTGFNISDFEKEHALFIDAAEEPWFNVDYRTWLRGDQRRRGNLWTFHNDNILIDPAPTAAAGYAGELYYYKTAPTITDAGSPQLPREGHQTIVWGTLTKFPHLFDGDLQLLLLKYEKDYAAGIARLKRTRASSQSFRGLHPKIKAPSTGTITFASS